MSDDNIQGAIRILDHTITIQLWIEQGGGWDDLVAWCKSCDPSGSDLMKVNVREVSGIHSLFENLMHKVAEHAFGGR